MTGFVGEYLHANPRMRAELVPFERGLRRPGFVVQSLVSTDRNKVSIKPASNPWTVCASLDHLQRADAPEHPRDLQAHPCHQ